MNNDFDSIICTSCKFRGEYPDSQKDAITLRNNAISLTRDHVRYSVSIDVHENTKTIAVSASKAVKLSDMWTIIVLILRFENLFEGCFYTPILLEANGKDYMNMIESILPLYRSSYTSGIFPFSYSDKEYRKLYYRWIEKSKELGIIHHVYLYSVFTNGMPPQVKLALLLEVFEPIADKECKKGTITIPVQTSPPILCPSCGTIARGARKKRVPFRSKLESLLSQYGKSIFLGKEGERAISKAYDTRNMVDHVNQEKKKTAMSGYQAAFYLYKFSLLYRYIVLLDLGIDQKELNDRIKILVQSFNKQYRKGRIMRSLPKRSQNKSSTP